jgi:hypothetical protein
MSKMFTVALIIGGGILWISTYPSNDYAPRAAQPATVVTEQPAEQPPKLSAECDARDRQAKYYYLTEFERLMTTSNADDKAMERINNKFMSMIGEQCAKELDANERFNPERIAEREAELAADKQCNLSPGWAACMIAVDKKIHKSSR